MKRTATAAVLMIVALISACAIAGCATAAAQEQQQEQTSKESAEQFETEPSDAAAQEETTTVTAEVDAGAEQPEEEAIEESDYSEYEPVWEADYYEDYCEPECVYSGGYSGSTATTLDELLNGQGRAYDENGTSYTWYYHDLGYGALDIPGETFDADGVSHDEDGYIVVATDAYEKGDVIETPYGDAKVYDSGCGNTIDVYTNR